MPSSTSSVKREIELDFIRGIAIAMVMVFHFQEFYRLPSFAAWTTLMDFGWVGVDVFFVLSGFLVGGLMMREWKSTGDVEVWRFLKRRAFKIWPAYYLFLFTAAIIHVHPLNTFFYSNLFNVQNYFPTTLAHTWSLAVEEHFYLGMAGLMALWTARKWRPSALIVLCLVGAVVVEIVRAIWIEKRWGYYGYTHTRIDPLLLGVALATVRNFYPVWFERLRSQKVVLWLVVAVAVWRLWVDKDAQPWPWFIVDSPWLVTFVDYAAVALFLLIYVPRERGEAGKQRSLPYRLMARLGIFSYGIYLWDMTVDRPLIWLLARTPHALVPVVSTFLPYVMAIALGVIVTKAVELPALRLRERLVPSRIPEARIPAA